MQIYDQRPRSLRGKHMQDSVPIGCDCRVDFLVLKSAGNSVTCPSCRATADLDIANARVLDPSVEAGQ